MGQLGFCFQGIIIINYNMKTIIVFSVLAALAVARPEARQSCPPGTPVQCGDNSCVLDASECPCPHENPMKCWDGSCAVADADCPAMRQSCPPGTPVQCGDNSCVLDASECPCPPENPK